MNPHSLLADWESFYAIIGSSAAALAGLQFVVITLGAEMNALGPREATRAFNTPTIVHFCAVLLISLTLSAPWPALSCVGLGLGACGVVGVAYAAIVVRFVRKQKWYKMKLYDWIWYCTVPLTAYVTLLAAVIALLRYPMPSLFVIAATAVVLLFVAIHNAWDSMMYKAQNRRKGSERTRDRSSAP